MIDLNSISRDPTIGPPRIMIYGSEKVGKSTFASEAAAPIFLPTEDGIGVLDVAHFPLLTTYDDFIGAIGVLYQNDHEFQTVVIDSVDWLEPLVWAETVRRNTEWTDIESPGYGKGYLAAMDVWREVIGGLDALRNEKNMAIILIAHAQVKRFDSPDVEPYDRYKIKLQDRAASKIAEWCDAIFFANYKTYTTKTEVGFNKGVTRGVGSGERVMYTEERPAFIAGNRYGLPTELPLSWEAFTAALSNSAAQRKK